MSDVTERAKRALDTYMGISSQAHDDRFIGVMREIVPELIAEIQRLRAAS